MNFRKRFWGTLLVPALLFPAGVAWGARVIISGTGSGNAIDTLTFSGGFLARPATVPAATEMLIFNTFTADSPDTVRNRIVAAGVGLESFTVSPVAGHPDEFDVDNIPPGGGLVILLDGNEVNSSSEGSASSKAGQYFRLTAGQIPALSEGGLVLFATLLLAGLVWFIRKKRRLARV